MLKIYTSKEIAKQQSKLGIEVISTRVLYHMKPEFEAIVNEILCKGIDISFEMEAYSD